MYLRMLSAKCQQFCPETVGEINTPSDHSGYELSQWETTLQHNVVSHWLNPQPEWCLHPITMVIWHIGEMSWVPNLDYQWTLAQSIWLAVPIMTYGICQWHVWLSEQLTTELGLLVSKPKKILLTDLESSPIRYGFRNAWWALWNLSGVS